MSVQDCRSVRVLYFAALRDVVGRSEERVVLPAEDATVAALGRHLEALHPELRERLGTVRFAVNEAFAAPEDDVPDGAEVALIPPVQGG